jgi:hypothetical protein
MSEVDYTQFVYKKNVNQKEDKKEGKKKEKNAMQAPDIKKGKSNKLFVFIVILLCFGLVFFSVDFFRNGQLSNLIANAFRGNSYSYYMVVSEHPTRELAFEQSALIKEGGGSGYIWNEEKYFVVYSLYMDKSDATTVANKNTRAYVKSVSYTSKKTEVFNFCNSLISTLSKASYDYETGHLTESELLSLTTTMLEEDIALKDNLLKTKSKESLNLLNLTIECLNNIKIVKSSKLEIISDMRYVCSSIAINMGDYI